MAFDWKEIGARLRLVRSMLGMEQQDFAKKLGVYPARWSNYEAGATLVPLETAAKVVEHFPASPWTGSISGAPTLCPWPCGRIWRRPIGPPPRAKHFSPE